jgi:dihydrofolate synthase / folylpolyglutamate synthase
MQEVRTGLAEATLPGRFQVLPGRPQIVLDVAHNPDAAATLAENLAASGFSPETIAVFGMLRDKDIAGVIRAVAKRITRWHVASLPGARGARAAELSAQLRDAGVSAPVTEYDSPAEAFAAARKEASENDKILIFGSFLTVGSVMAWLETERGGEARHG